MKLPTGADKESIRATNNPTASLAAQLAGSFFSEKRRTAPRRDRSSQLGMWQADDRQAGSQADRWSQG